MQKMEIILLVFNVLIYIFFIIFIPKYSDWKIQKSIEKTKQKLQKQIYDYQLFEDKVHEVVLGTYEKIVKSYRKTLEIKSLLMFPDFKSFSEKDFIEFIKSEDFDSIQINALIECYRNDITNLDKLHSNIFIAHQKKIASEEIMTLQNYFDIHQLYFDTDNMNLINTYINKIEELFRLQNFNDIMESITGTSLSSEIHNMREKESVLNTEINELKNKIRVNFRDLISGIK